MADTIRIGNLEIDDLKIGSLSVDALYIGDVKVYPPTPSWSAVTSGTDVSGLTASQIRVSTAVTLSESHNVTFGNIDTDTYTLLYENGAWYNWRLITSGAYTPDSKTQLTSSNGYYTIDFGQTYNALGVDGNEFGPSGLWNTPFEFEITI